MSRVRIVLSRTSHPGNIGAAARAMKTMGFGRLVLAAPRCRPDDQAVAMACGAGDVLATARIVSSLGEALEGVVLAFGLTCRRRELASEPLWARAAASELAGVAAQEGEVAVVFGNEATGLTNDELAQCGRWAMIPANPAYASLNLGAAVQLMCYELRLAILGTPPLPAVARAAPATHEQIEGLLAQLEGLAIQSGFLDPQRPSRLMLRLRRLFCRAGLEKTEVNLLRGLFASFERPTGKKHRSEFS